MNIDDIDRRLRVGINVVFLLLAFFLPLILSTRSSEVFELPKMLFGYAATAIIVGLWLGRIVLRREILIRQTPLDIPILLFLISQIASTIYSIDPQVSWWGWYGRFHGGLWSTISYTLLYYALISNFSGSYKGSISRTVKLYNGKTVVGEPVRQYTVLPSYRSTDYRFTVSQFHRFLIKAILSSALVVSVYAILQHFGIDQDFWVQDVVNRVFSTQGQPNWLAAFLVMAIPLTFAMTISEIINHKSYINMISYFLFMIYALALLWTKSRSGLLGLAAADLVFWSLIFFRFHLLKKASYIDQQRSFKKEPTFLGIKKLYRLSTIVDNLYNSVDYKDRDRDRDREKVGLVNLAKPFILIHVLMAGLILVTDNPVREYIFQKSQLISAKISSNQIMDKSDKSESEISDISIIRFLADFSRNSDFSGNELRKSELGGTESGDIRRLVWSGALQLVKQRPVFGFGPETFGETYWRVRPKEHNLTSEWNFLYNKAHNEWLNLAANTGIFGLGSHILLLVWFIVWSFNQLKIRNPKFPPAGAPARLATCPKCFAYRSRRARSVAGRWSASDWRAGEIRNNDQNPKFKNSKLNSHGFDKSNFEFVSNFEIRASDLTIAALLAAVVGVEAVNFFGFSTVTVGVYRYLFMAAAVSAAGNTNKLLKTLPDRQGSSVINIVLRLLKPIADRAVSSVIQERNKDKKESRLVISEGRILKGVSLKVRRCQYFLLAAIVVGVFWIISGAVIRFLADLNYNRGRAYQDAGYIEEAVEPLMRAVNLVPGEPVFRAELAEAEGTAAALLLRQRTENGERRTENLGIQRPGLPPEVQALSEIITQLKNNSIANFEIVRRQSPQNLGFIRTQAKVLFLLGSCSVEQRDSSSRPGVGTQNDGSPPCEQALQLMKLGMELAPTNPQLPYSLGLMLTKMGRSEEAAVYFIKALELKPDWAEAREKL